MKNRNFIHSSDTEYPRSRNNRLLGIFYFLWLGTTGWTGKPKNISEITAEHPDAGYHPDADYWGEVGFYHHWGEPFYGYYFSDDEWVVRKHMKLLLQAGVDFLFFDTTNAVIYEENAKLVMRVLEEYHLDGWNIPKVMFYTNTASGKTVQEIFDKIYKPGFAPDTWFRLDGKPVIIANPEECSAETREFFNIKLAQWPNEPDKIGGWPWMDFTRPQRVFANFDGEDECINVSVAQHPQIKFGDSVLYGETANRGRAYHDGANDPSPDAYKYCGNFIEQFERALEADVPVTLVTGWNEWIAGRWQGSAERPIMFVDCANYEYSRDIEMMRGGYFDNYYKVLCDYSAKLRGIGDETILDQGEKTIFFGYPDGNFNRNAPGYGTTYRNRSGRYPIREIKVENSSDSVKFTLASVRDFDLGTDGSFMQLYLSVNGTNYRVSSDGISAITDGDGKFMYSNAARIRCDIHSSSVEYVIPKAVLGMQSGGAIDFKAADSRDEITSAEDFYDHGDVIPLGYAYYRVIIK